MPRKKRDMPARHYITPDEVQLMPISGKQLGVAAVVDLPPNSRLPYLGRKINQEAYERLQLRNTANPGKHLHLGRIISS